MPEGENSIVDLKKYLATPENPVPNQEFKDFWESLTEAEKKEFKQTKLE
jgi:folate-dependent tRNA-U54 methylase TrmFO/GidA